MRILDQADQRRTRGPFFMLFRPFSQLAVKATTVKAPRGALLVPQNFSGVGAVWGRKDTVKPWRSRVRAYLPSNGALLAPQSFSGVGAKRDTFLPMTTCYNTKHEYAFH